jgi:hypothetical protein
MVTWPHELGQNIMAVEACGGKGSSFHGQGSREQGRNQRPGVTFTGMLPVTHFLQLGPTYQNSAAHPGPNIQHMSLQGICHIQAHNILPLTPKDSCSFHNAKCI